MPTATPSELEQVRSYCLERLKDIRVELARLSEEAPPLLAELEQKPEKKRTGEIRSRRAYLKQRSGELKDERARLTAELEAVRAKLKKS